MQIASSQYADVLLLNAQGRLDHNTAASFREAITPHLAASNPIVIFDFSALEYISSAGLRELLIASKQRKADNCVMVVAEATDVVNEVFEISRFNLVIDLYPTVTDALTAVSASALAEYQR